MVVVFLHLLLPEVVDEVTHAVDVVGQSYAAYHFDENQAAGLHDVGSSDVTEPDRQHDSGTPVVPPDVLLEPTSTQEHAILQPVGVIVEVRHRIQNDGQEVRKREIDDQHIEQPPILLSIEAGDMQILNGLQLFQHFGKLEQHNPPKILELCHRIGYDEVNQQQQCIGQVDHEPPLEVLHRYLVEEYQGLTVMVPLQREAQIDMHEEFYN